LWCLGAAVKKYMFNGGYDVFINVIRNLEELEKTIAGDWMPLAERTCLERYPDLKDSFKKFKDEMKKKP
jgi:hypothetical protein